jgi:hypothetical protein
MANKISLKAAFGISLATLFLLQFQNCSQPANFPDSDEGSQQSQSNELALILPSSSLVVGATMQLTGSGGVRPYSFAVKSGPATVSPNGVLQAGNSAGSVVVAVSDSNGTSTQAGVEIVITNNGGGNSNSNGSCLTPWGASIPNGQRVVAFGSRNVDFGMTCRYEVRQCNNGSLSGSFHYEICFAQGRNEGPDTLIAPPAPNSTQPLKRSCAIPFGGTIQDGQYVFAYKYNAVGSYSAEGCAAEKRYCNDGQLSGSYQYKNCTVDVSYSP